MDRNQQKSVAVIVAHPDDETLWAGGTILSHPAWKWFIICLCRGSDTERSIRFYNALKVLKSEGIMGDLDDGPEQKPLDEKYFESSVLTLLPPSHFDLIVTHSPTGEYTRHLRHEETGRTVIKLWDTGKISANELWTFEYEDGGKKYLPRPVKNSTIYNVLAKRIWLKKHSIITKTYGFEKNSFEAETTPRAESFRQFTDPREARRWCDHFENL
jgi:LmbE family N-acetylglucosaminyl deacetylase